MVHTTVVVDEGTNEDHALKAARVLALAQDTADRLTSTARPASRRPRSCRASTCVRMDKCKHGAWGQGIQPQAAGKVWSGENPTCTHTYTSGQHTTSENHHFQKHVSRDPQPTPHTHLHAFGGGLHQRRVGGAQGEPEAPHLQSQGATPHVAAWGGGQ